MEQNGTMDRVTPIEQSIDHSNEFMFTPPQIGPKTDEQSDVETNVEGESTNNNKPPLARDDNPTHDNTMILYTAEDRVTSFLLSILNDKRFIYTHHVYKYINERLSGAKKNENTKMTAVSSRMM
ncbi:uncharacterized protein LOC126836082 [Adelges cooleyi]|uniref:uncharacterized protein LOC126836082 n=1 Tax=Adelges cooleyi TaxID=133065 RepID=UPI002180332D|nr:uncharacterized protein LOC126836082 [Adelges cooleyi]